MILVGVTDNNVFAAKQKTVEKSLEEYKEVLNYTAEYKEYSEYISQYEKADKPTDEYVIDAADYIASEGMNMMIMKEWPVNRFIQVRTDM